MRAVCPSEGFRLSSRGALRSMTLIGSSLSDGARQNSPKRRICGRTISPQLFRHDMDPVGLLLACLMLILGLSSR